MFFKQKTCPGRYHKLQRRTAQVLQFYPTYFSKTMCVKIDTVHVIPLVLISLSVEELDISVFPKGVVYIFTMFYPRSYFIVQYSVLFAN